MQFDAASILAFLASIDPCAAAVGAAVLLVVQKFVASKLGNNSAVLLAVKSFLGRLLHASPAKPDEPKPAPVPAPVVPGPILPLDPNNDLLKDRPVLKAIRDAAQRLLLEFLNRKFASAEDEHDALKQFKTFADLLALSDEDKVKVK